MTTEEEIAIVKEAIKNSQTEYERALHQLHLDRLEQKEKEQKNERTENNGLS